MSEDRLLIIGLGNPLMGDDGAGIEIVNELMRSDLPECVDLIDGGTPGVGLIDLMSGYERVIVVDAVKVEGGMFSEVPVMRLQHCNPELVSGSQTKRAGNNTEKSSGQRFGMTRDKDNCSLHETELSSVVRLMQTLGMTIPEISIVGINAVNLAPGIGLSQECRRLIPQAVNLIKEAVEQVGRADLMLPESGGYKS
ncbi:MAG: hydrogenase maturation protease [Nitrospirae bacterium]|nr:hydrogenase maturation protease [Nitrospirota bacterium]